jgi:hypothetical protein
LRTNLLAEAWIARRLVRTWAGLVRMRSRVQSQLDALLADLGVIPELTTLFGPAGRRWLAELPMAASAHSRLEAGLRLIDAITVESSMLMRQTGRPASALPSGQVVTGGMTTGMTWVPVPRCRPWRVAEPVPRPWRVLDASQAGVNALSRKPASRDMSPGRRSGGWLGVVVRGSC